LCWKNEATLIGGIVSEPVRSPLLAELPAKGLEFLAGRVANVDQWQLWCTCTYCLELLTLAVTVCQLSGKEGNLKACVRLSAFGDHRK
jgi:hypothetical protein